MKRSTQMPTSVVPEEQSSDQDIIDVAKSDNSIPHLYMNAVVLAGSNSDVCVGIVHNGIPVATINMSFTVAKSLGVGIAHLIAELEASTGQPIMTMDYIREKMSPSDTKQ